MRYSIYLLQINVLSALAYVFFTASYRKGEEFTLYEDVLDGKDINTIVKIGLIGSILLLPFINEPLNAAASNALVQETEDTVVVSQRRGALRGFLCVSALVTTFMLPVWAIIASASVPLKMQYCIAAVVPATIILSAGMNLLYLALVACVVKSQVQKFKRIEKDGSQTIRFFFTDRMERIGCMVAPKKARQVALDMKAVDSVKSMFTLADVLPSSLLEISQADVHSRSLLQEALGLSMIGNAQGNDSNIKLNSNADRQADVKAEDSNQTDHDQMAEQEKIELTPKNSIVKEGLAISACGSNTQLNENMINSNPVRDHQMKAEDRIDMKHNDGDDTMRSNRWLLGTNLDQLKDSALDLSNSRNDVLPQRT